MQQPDPHGRIDQSKHGRKNDYLYRISMKSLIMNEAGEVLVVKEAGRKWWDLPGGGMDHRENIRTAIKRELVEEVNLTGDFTYKIIEVDDPVYLPTANVLQVRLIFHVVAVTMVFSAGEDADQVQFINPQKLKDSTHPIERKVAAYAFLVNQSQK